MNVVIVDYGAGNIFSVQQAFIRLGIGTVLSKDEAVIRSASHVIFPGVGHAKKAMEELKKTGLDKVLPELKQPVFGICLGMQLMCGWNEEGELNGLGIFDTKVFELKKRILELTNSQISEIENSQIHQFIKYRRTPENAEIEKGFVNYKFPHMGWNDVQMDSNTRTFYFVHSYAAEICKHTFGTTEYPISFSSALRKENFWGVQFHPEKSGKVGEALLIDFLSQKTFL